MSGTREVISLFADGDTRLLIGTTNDGVFSFDGQEAEPDPAFAKLRGSTVRSIVRTNDGTFWFATNRGVYLCRPGYDCVVAGPDLDARSLVAVSASNSNGVWCATTGGGLVQIVLDDQLGPVVAQLDTEQGLPSQNVFAVLPHQNSDRSNILLIGTSRGIARYVPGQIAPTLYATRIISKRVHRPGELSSGLNLEYPQNSLLFEVAANSSRTFPEQFQYAFTLTDKKGNVVKQKVSRESQFAIEGLRPGKYKVLARAFTKDLVSSSPLSFELNVAARAFSLDFHGPGGALNHGPAGSVMGHSGTQTDCAEQVRRWYWQIRISRMPGSILPTRPNANGAVSLATFTIKRLAIYGTCSCWLISFQTAANT